MFISSVVTLCVCLLASSAGQAVSVPQADLNLRAFLMPVYPELAGRPIQIETIGRREGLIEISVSEVSGDGSQAGGQSPLLTSAVEFFPNHEVRAFDASGVFLESGDKAALGAAVRAAMPVRRATAHAVVDVIRHVTARSAPPLVLKVDNGSPFGSGLLQNWAHRAGTRLLFSPPAYPAYNGSIEASIGALTGRTHELAAVNGHPERWTTEDIEAARIAVNVTPSGAPRSESPARRWQRATPPTRTERGRFLACYRRQLATITARAGAAPNTATRAQCRTAIVRTLDTLGYVSMRRRADLVHQLIKKNRQRLRT